MSEPYFGSPEEAASELGAPLLVAASAASALPRVGRKLSEFAVESILGAHLFHRLRLASPLIPQVIWVTGPHGALEHIGWAVAIAEHAAAAGRPAFLAFLDGVQPLQSFAAGSGLVLPRAILARMAGFGIHNAAGWVSDLQGVRLVFPSSGEPGGDAPNDPFRWILIIARALPEGIETTQRYREAAEGVIFAAAIRDHYREELVEAARALHAPGAPLLGVITMGPVTAGALPIIERWERILTPPMDAGSPRPGEPGKAPASEPESTKQGGAREGTAPPETPAFRDSRVSEPAPTPPTSPPPSSPPPSRAPAPAPPTSPPPTSPPPPRAPAPPPPPTQTPAKPPAPPRVPPPVPPPSPAPPVSQPPQRKQPGQDEGAPASPPLSVPRPPLSPPRPRPSVPQVVADLGEGVRPNEAPVPLVEAWLSSDRRRRRGRRIAMWAAGVIVVAVGAYLLRGEFMPGQTKPGAPVVRRPVPADSSISSIPGGPVEPSTERVMSKRDTIPPILPLSPAHIDSMREMSRRDLTPVSPSAPPARPAEPPSISGTEAPLPSSRESVTPAPSRVARPESTWVKLTRADSNAEGGGSIAPSVAGPDTFIIHVSSFQQRGQAETEAQRLRGLGIDARVASAFLPSRGMWYRVVLGAFPDSMDAWREAMRLREMGYIAFAQILKSGERKK